MPSLSTVGIFLLAGLIVLVIPGHTVLYIVTRSMTQGKQAGLASVLGVELGSLAHVAAATLGLSALLMTSALVFGMVKYLGAAYLIYLGVRALLTREENQRAIVSAPRNFSQLVAQGLLVDLLNPKTALFFFAFLPQFVDPARGAVGGQILLLGTLFVMLASGIDSLYALLASTVGRWLKRNSRSQQIRRYVTGTVYIGFGLSAAFAGAEKK